MCKPHQTITIQNCTKPHARITDPEASGCTLHFQSPECSQRDARTFGSPNKPPNLWHWDGRRGVFGVESNRAPNRACNTSKDGPVKFPGCWMAPELSAAMDWSSGIGNKVK